MYWNVKDNMKEQSVRVKKFLLVLKNIAQKECALRYWVSVQLKIKQWNHTPLYEKDTKWNQNRAMETAGIVVDVEKKFEKTELPYHQVPSRKPQIPSRNKLFLLFKQQDLRQGNRLPERGAHTTLIFTVSD